MGIRGSGPLDLLDRPFELRRWLTAEGVFRFEPYRSGLYPASALPAEQSAATGMGMAWFRDNAHVAMALLDDGRVAEATRVGEAMLSVLGAEPNRSVLVGRRGGTLPVRVDGDTLENDVEPRVQNDSTGYALWLLAVLADRGHMNLEPDDWAILAGIGHHLIRREYWRDADDGHWEEDRCIHASSIGTVVAGLRAFAGLCARRGVIPDADLEAAIGSGMERLSSILGSGRTEWWPEDDEGLGATSPGIPPSVTVDRATRSYLESFDATAREADAALLFLVEPLRVLDDGPAADVVSGVEEHLLRPHGMARYRGDTYWEPRFPDIMSVDERTRAAEGRIEQRNLTQAGVALTETEAQWTLFDPILSVHWGRTFLANGRSEDREKQERHLRRSLGQLVPTADGHGLPEAYYLEFDATLRENRWVQNDHTPLLWSQANLLRALNAWERTCERAAVGS